MIWEILLTLFLVFLNGFFVAAEFAIVKVRLSQIELRARSGSWLAGLARNMVTHLDAYLSATQLGITLASLGLGWIGETVVSEIVIDIMHGLGYNLSPELAHSISFPIAFAIITVLHIVLGELAPKSLAIQRSEAVTLGVVIPMKFFYFIFRPFIVMLNFLATVILKRLGIEPAKEQDLHSPEEIRYLLEESSKSGMFEDAEHELLENVFEFTLTEAHQIMTPRTQIAALDITMQSGEILDKFMEEGYSRMPVYRDTLDNIVGVVYAKDLLTLMCNRNLIVLEDIIRPAYFVQEEEKIPRLLKRLQQARVHMAVVLDEFGGTAGIVTMENIMEELVGQIQDEYDEEDEMIEDSNANEFIIHATAPIYDLNEQLPVPLPQSDDYETLGGLINFCSGRIPEEGETVHLPNYNCTIIRGTSRNVELVRLILNGEEGYDNSGE